MRPRIVPGRRHHALVGGTTSWTDAAVAARHLVDPGAVARQRQVLEYERAFAHRVGVAEAISFSAGRVALFAILRALGVGAGDEVLVPAPTHVVVPNAVAYTGAAPVYVDCRLDTYCMDLDDARRRVTSRTKVLLLQHTFGIPADVQGAQRLAKEQGLVLVEDCVHALGARHRGRPVGSLGHAAIFSTEETKTISTTMGGMAVTDDPALAAALREAQAACTWPPRRLVAQYMLKLIAYHVTTSPRLHGATRALYEAVGKRTPLPRPTSVQEMRAQRPAGYERRLSSAQAALGSRQLARLDENVTHRRSIAAVYEQELGPARRPAVPDSDEPSWLRYPVWVEDRDRVLEALRPLAVLGSWFTSVLEEAESPDLAGYRAGSCPRAEAVARHLVNLSTHGRVTEADARRLVAALRPYLDPEPDPVANGGAPAAPDVAAQLVAG